MNHKEIRIIVRRDGTSSVEAVGFQGVGCKAATEAIEIALGGRDDSNRKTDPKGEMYATDNSSAYNVGQ